MPATPRKWCDPDDPHGFGPRGVDKTELMRCARMALLARQWAVPLGCWETPLERAVLTMAAMFGPKAVRRLRAKQIAVGAARLFLIDLLTGGRAIGLATAEQYASFRRGLEPLRRRWMGRVA